MTNVLEAPKDKMDQEFDEILNTFSLDIKEAKQITDSKTLKKFIIDGTTKIISFKKDNIESELFDHFQRFIVLKTIDKEWQDHLYMMDQLREGIGLRAYGQKNPLIEYKHEGFAMFESMMKSTNTETLKRIFQVKFKDGKYKYETLDIMKKNMESNYVINSNNEIKKIINYFLKEF